MEFGRSVRGTLLASALCCAMLLPAGTLQAATFLEFVDSHPGVYNSFGATVVALSTGNVVVTSPSDAAGGSYAGAVYLFNGSTGALISTLRGSTASDGVGSGGVIALSNGNFVVLSPYWGTDDVGAVTWGSGTAGVSGVVSAANSLVGSTYYDQVGSSGVTVLSNGNYLVRSLNWDNGAVVNAGAVTWGSGMAGVAGVVSAANSLVGSTYYDQVGSGGVTVLSNGNYLVRSDSWDNGAVSDAGAVTWGSGMAGVTGAVSTANSLVGSTAGDAVGSDGVTALSNGNYVVSSSMWNNGAVAYAGAVTWGSGTTGVSGVVSAANSLVGSAYYARIGYDGVTALSNGNYVVASSSWDDGAIIGAGAVTWGSGTTGVTGTISAANSLVGSTTYDQVGGGGVTALANGNYVVRSSSWDNGATFDAGAATWGSGTTGVIGVVSATNSLVGSTDYDNVGSGGMTALANGNYVVCSPNWDNGATASAGAATWGSGASGVTGVVSAANSLVGSTAYDDVGSGGVTALANGNYVVVSPVCPSATVAGSVTWGSGTTGVTGVVSAANSLVGSTVGDYVGNSGVTALSNGNYLVRSVDWDNGPAISAGAVTWGSGTAGVTGVVSPANSLVGSASNDSVGNGGTTELSNGSYLVRSPGWDYSAVADAGAVTWGSGTGGATGVVSTANSLVGSVADDRLGSDGVTALANGNFVVANPNWDNGVVLDVGSVTWGSGTAGVTGSVSSANSLVGSMANDDVGSGGVTALADGNYVVCSPNWDNTVNANAGAATWCSGTTGVIGVISAANSLVGTTANASLQPVVVDDVNNTFFGRFLWEGGGRVRVGPLDFPPTIVSAVDIPNDQGGWLRLTFARSSMDIASSPTPATAYGIWRHVPGTIPPGAARATLSAALSAREDAASTEWLRAALPAGLDVWEVEGRFYATRTGSRGAEITSAFPFGTWELATSVPAMQRAQYVVAVPTISNAAANDFVVTAHTTAPSLWFVSAPASGQSVDNLAPAPPTSFTAVYSSGQTHLQWAANTENDLGSYRLYRGTSAGFTPAIGNRIATQISTSYADVGPAGSYYKLGAVDVNGNESGFALITPGGTLDVGDDAPLVFALAGVRPNPSRGERLSVAFTLPTAATARLELLDVSGRRVVEREVGSLGAGPHAVDLGQGTRLAPGLYLVRLTQGANTRVARVAVLQ